MRTPKQVRERAKTFYSRNHRSWLSGQFKPLAINLQPPSGRAAERDDGAAVRTWVEQWERAGIGAAGIEAEWQEKKLSYLGTYSLPTRVLLDRPETAAQVAGTADHWSRINTLLERMCTELGESCRPQLIARLSSWESWDDVSMEQFIQVVHWLRSHDASEFYIRELPIHGVDTKWLESRRGLVEAVVGELNFKAKPQLVELRSLDRELSINGMRHLACPLGDVDALPGERVLIVENHQTFLALPPLPGTIAMFGGGLNAYSLAKNLPVLGGKEVLYWGDLDSHGFYILELVRRVLPGMKSVLMDLDTAREHIDLAVEEPQANRFAPELLTPQETFALEYLRTNAEGQCLRIEQERIRFDFAVAELRRMLAVLDGEELLDRDC